MTTFVSEPVPHHPFGLVGTILPLGCGMNGLGFGMQPEWVMWSNDIPIREAHLQVEIEQIDQLEEMVMGMWAAGVSPELAGAVVLVLAGEEAALEAMVQQEEKTTFKPLVLLNLTPPAA